MWSFRRFGRVWKSAVSTGNGDLRLDWESRQNLGGKLTAWSLLWIKCLCSLPNSYAEALTPDVMVFGGGA